MKKPDNVTETKNCTRCKITKPFTQFTKNNASKDKLKAACKECISIYSKSYTIENRDKIKLYGKHYRELNSETIPQKIKEYQKKNKEKIYKKSTEYHKNKYNTDPNFKMRRLLRDRIGKTISKNKITKKTNEFLGCSIDYFRKFIEDKFFPEMSWENHGNVWELDHIKPCASFDLLNIEQQKECFHYSNFQPLFKTTEIAESFGYTNQIGNRNKSKNKNL
jgi:hypothetical protein